MPSGYHVLLLRVCELSDDTNGLPIFSYRSVVDIMQPALVHVSVVYFLAITYTYPNALGPPHARPSEVFVHFGFPARAMTVTRNPYLRECGLYAEASGRLAYLYS
jgi:hypothetical protein